MEATRAYTRISASTSLTCFGYRQRLGNVVYRAHPAPAQVDARGRVAFLRVLGSVHELQAAPQGVVHELPEPDVPGPAYALYLGGNVIVQSQRGPHASQLMS